MLRTLSAILLLVVVISCKKNNSDEISPEHKEQAAKLQTHLEANSFRLDKYYSEKPIDYIDTDQVVKAETELWQYVSEWLHDDEYIFNANGTVTIKQNAIKIPTSNSETITKSFDVEADKDGVLFRFVGHEYQDLNYRLISFNDSVVKVSATWNNKTVISEYKLLE
jgi:transposase